MAHLQYMPGDQRLVDQLVYELKSKGIFDQFRKDCIADVDTRPAYQNLRQRVETSVTTFLARQKWRPDLNKNQLREKLRKHILDGNYLDQGVERIVDQVVNPKVASVFIPQVEDLVCNYLGIKINKTTTAAETSNGKHEDLLPTDLEAVSPGSVKSNEGKDDPMDICSTDNTAESKMEMDEDSKPKLEINDESSQEKDETHLSGISDLTSHSSDSIKINIPLPADIDPENIPPPDNSPPQILLDQIKPPKVSDIPLPDAPMPENIATDRADKIYFKPSELGSEDDLSSNSSDLRRNMSPLTPVRNFDDENSCDAQQGFDDTSEVKTEDKKDEAVGSFNFNVDLRSANSADVKTERKESLSFQFENQVKIKTPVYEESSNSNNLQIDYESDANSKTNQDSKPDPDQSSQDVKKEKSDERKSHKSSHRSRDSHRHSSSSKDRRSESKQSSSRDKRDDKKSRDNHNSSKSKSSHRERSKDRNDKTSRDSSKHRQSSSCKSSSKDFKSHRSSSSSRRNSSSKHSDEKKSSSSSSNRERSDKSSSKDHKSSKDSKSSSHRSDKDKKSSSSRSKNEKDKEKKDKKDTDDHYSLSGRGNNNRRSTDRDSNDGNSSSSKGSNNQSSSKAAEAKKDKGESSKSGSTTSSSGTSPSDKDNAANDKISNATNVSQSKPIVRVETHLEMPITNNSPVRFMPEVVLKKPKFASNLEEARKMMKMRKFLDEEQRRMNQEAALLLEFQANVRPSLSQVYSNISGPELEFACVNNIPEINDHEVDEETLETTEIRVPYEDEFVEIDPQTVESIAEIQKEVDNITNDRDSDEESQESGAENKTTAELFEVTIVSDDDMSDMEINDASVMHNYINQNEINDIIGVPCTDDIPVSAPQPNSDRELQFFSQQEQYNAELYKDQFSKFLKSYTDGFTSKLFLVNCDTYYENVFKDVSQSLGNYTVVTFRRNGHKLPKATKNIDFSNKEITIPINSADVKSPLSFVSQSPFMSPIKSECSFELSSDYDAKLEDMVNNTSRQQVMEIILGGIIGDGSPSKMPKIDICNESNIEISCKRKYSEIESHDNNNRQVLTPNKIRKISCSDQITSTTGDVDDVSSNHRNHTTIVRSKFLGKAKRVGLPKPKRCLHSNSPSSDKSVENYEQNNAAPPINGKIKTTRYKVQRYSTSDLYKPKQNFLSRRNNIS